ncbi:MAG TPA: hypothetical protein VGV87_20775 [Blastocatellia bacterium]|jgi:hypothetical protein|nr:hypothetical protein [Blastocatellia bacterium]
MGGGNEEKPHRETPNVSHIHTEGVAHEESDVEVGGVAWFTAGLAALMILTAVLMWGMFRFFARTEHKKEPPPTSLTREKKPEGDDPELMFPEPRLQQHPALELQQYRDEENTKLTTYGWLDPTTGVVRIPIEDAKRKLLKQGLPYRQAPSPPPAIEAPKHDGLTGNAESKAPTAAPAHEVKH